MDRIENPQWNHKITRTSLQYRVTAFYVYDDQNFASINYLRTKMQSTEVLNNKLKVKVKYIFNLSLYNGFYIFSILDKNGESQLDKV